MCSLFCEVDSLLIGKYTRILLVYLPILHCIISESLHLLFKNQESLDCPISMIISTFMGELLLIGLLLPWIIFQENWKRKDTWVLNLEMIACVYNKIFQSITFKTLNIRRCWMEGGYIIIFMVCNNWSITK